MTNNSIKGRSLSAATKSPLKGRRTSMTGAEIKDIRDAMGMTREDFAQIFGVHTTTVYRWETNSSEIGKDAIRFLTALRQILDRNGVVGTRLGDDIRSALSMNGALRAIYVLLKHYFNE